jgi:hypothetical protein
LDDPFLVAASLGEMGTGGVEGVLVERVPWLESVREAQSERRRPLEGGGLE